jgi:ubiquinone/menaquinone biosynthesis C-methylase UbiE
MSRVRPVRTAAGAIVRTAPQLAPRLERLTWRAIYEAASFGKQDGWLNVMNYGYAPLDDVVVGEWPEDERFGVQLYAKVAGATDLAGKDVLEVGCGRGGGAAFVHDRFGLRSMTGLDLARNAIEHARARYSRPGLEFLAGDAESLPFADATFDAVLSVESSHCYADMPRFLRETHRVLRPNGKLLLADGRPTDPPAPTERALFHRLDVRLLREQLAAASFRVADEDDITANVMRALELNTPKMRARIEQRFPRFVRKHALAFVATADSPTYQAFTDRKLTYVRFVLDRV